MEDQGTTLDDQALVARDAAEFLYGQSVGGMAVTLLASSFLAYMVMGRNSHSLVIAWWFAMVAGLFVRALDTMDSDRRRTSPFWAGKTETRRFGLGVALTATVWIAFPLAFFHSSDLVDRAAMAIILSCMAGGSATTLAGSLPISISYCAALLLPQSFLFIHAAGVENRLLGTLGFIFFIVMVVSTRVTHASTMRAFRLNRANETLLAVVKGQREFAEVTNAELERAQFALRQSNISLESRIQARTSDLEHEIAERKRYAEELSRLASTDSLTGLYNRAMLTEQLLRTVALAEQAPGLLAVLFVDLDRFKEVNDVKGHHAGDCVLQSVATRFSNSLPVGTDLARWGGDEFVIILRELANPQQAVEVAEALRRSLRAPIDIEHDTVVIDATVGISIFPAHGATPDELIRAADVAMYAGKEDRRGEVRLFDPSLAEDLAERHELEKAFREALSSNSLSLAFQPIVDAASERCESLEALARWNHPVRGNISPGIFIPIAERSGEIVTLGRWVLRESCRAAASWSGDHIPAVSVNVSVAQILNGDIVGDIFEELVRSNLPPHRLHIEITESVFVTDLDRIVSALRRLREKGVQVSLDDFGTGFSSLSCLQNLPIDNVKIDQSFIRAMGKDSDAVVGAIVSLARALNLRVIAEGVEHREQAAMLHEMGVDYLQGYLFSRPLPSLSVCAWLTEQEGGRLEDRYAAALVS